MKHIITFTKPDGTEINFDIFDANTKITINDTHVGEDAVYETIYTGALLTDLNSGNCEITLKFKADYCETILKSTK